MAGIKLSFLKRRSDKAIKKFLFIFVRKFAISDSPSTEMNGHNEEDRNHPLEKLFVSQLQLMSRFNPVGQIYPAHYKMLILLLSHFKYS